jgi:hypothetical protein
MGCIAILAVASLCLIVGAALANQWLNRSPDRALQTEPVVSLPSASVTQGPSTPVAASTAGQSSPPFTSTAESCGAPVSVFAEADTWIDQNSSENNFGTDAILKVRSQESNDNFRALIHFALPSAPRGCVVQSAVLSLYAAAWADGRTLEVVRVSGAWLEDSVSWSSQPASSEETAMTTSGSGYRLWDVTSLVRAMYSLGANHGFLIRDAAEGGSGAEQQFHSKEKGENLPVLEISFAPAGE